MSNDTRPKGWHDDFASDRPEHARRQGFASPTGPDTRQADLVSRERVLGILNGWIDACNSAEPNPHHATARTMLLTVKDEVRKL